MKLETQQLNMFTLEFLAYPLSVDVWSRSIISSVSGFAHSGPQPVTKYSCCTGNAQNMGSTVIAACWI